MDPPSGHLSQMQMVSEGPVVGLPAAASVSVGGVPAVASMPVGGVPVVVSVTNGPLADEVVVPVGDNSGAMFWLVSLEESFCLLVGFFAFVLAAAGAVASSSLQD